MNFLTFNKRFLVKVFVFVFLVFLVVQCIGLAKRQIPDEIHTNSSTIGETFITELTSLAEHTENGQEIKNELNRVRYFRGRVSNFNQSQARKQFF